MSTTMETRTDYCHDVIIKNTDTLSFNITVKGVLIKHEKNFYLNIPHTGLDVKMIIFNNKEYNDFKYSEWSENIIVELNKDDIFDYQYVFKKFGIKCIDVSKKLTLNNYNCKYIKNEHFPVNMMVDNPEIMFYVLKSEQKESPETGTPLHYNGVLYGIFSRYNSEKNHCYIMPYIFIQKSIKNVNNYLFKCTNLNLVKKIYRNNVHNDMIYCPQIQYNINLESYLLYLSNSSNKILINESNDTYLIFKKTNKKILNNTFLLHWCKMFNKEILIEIIKNYDSRCDKHKMEINGKKHIFVY